LASEIGDAGDTIGSALGMVAREVAESVSSNGIGGRDGAAASLGGLRGVAAGAALAAAAPLAGTAVKRLIVRRVGRAAAKGPKKLAGDVKETVSEGLEEAVSDKMDRIGGAPKVASKVGKKVLPSLGGKSKGGKGKGKGTPGVGKGRRMPVQQSADIAVPLAVAYNQWTQFEEWPQFMHRLDQATQEDECTVSFRVKVWGMSKEFVAQIVEQRPDERIQWNVTEGARHTGVVTFHELAPRLTRVQVSLDVEPGTWIEKAARGMRHVKRAVRADMARFKAFIEMQEVETGAWRGVIHDGEVVKQHDPKYDRQREYAEFDDIHDREHSHQPQKQARKSKSRGAKKRKRGASHASGRSSSSKKSRSGSSRKRGSSR
jgi:uncharacterized membrane protein